MMRLFLLIGCALLFSCQEPKIVPIIDMDKIGQSITLDVEDILKDITMVQIDNDFLLSVKDQVYVTSKYLVIYVNNQSLHLFNREGKHIRKLAEKGNGPREFLLVQYFFMDKDERILYYVDNRNSTSLIRIDVSSGKELEPLQIGFNYRSFYINEKIYSFPNVQYHDAPDYHATGYPDSATVASSYSLRSGELVRYQGRHTYSPLVMGSSITSYYDEVVLLNLGYSDTLFTLKNNKLSPLCVLNFSDKMTTPYKPGSGCEIISAYNSGIVFAKLNIFDQIARYRFNRIFFALYDRKGNTNIIDHVRFMDTQINLTNLGKFDRQLQLSALLPIACGKYAYMWVEHDVLKPRPAHFDPNNDNPIIVVGTLK